MSLAYYGHPFSSYTWKGLIALYANGTPFEYRELKPGDADQKAFLEQAHPAGKFPILVDGETVIIEATAIIEYLHARHPGAAALLPVDPVRASMVRMLDRVFDNYVMANLQRVVNAYLANRDAPDPGEIEAGRSGLRSAYAWLERWLEANSFPAPVSLATCAAAPSLFYADWVERIPEGSRLAALRADLLALPEVARCVDDARPYRPWFPPGAPDRD